MLLVSPSSRVRGLVMAPAGWSDVGVVVQKSWWPPGLLRGVISAHLSIREARKGEQPFISSCFTSSSGELYLPSKCGQTVSSQQGGVFLSTHRAEQLM